MSQLIIVYEETRSCLGAVSGAQCRLLTVVCKMPQYIAFAGRAVSTKVDAENSRVSEYRAQEMEADGRLTGC